MRLKIRLHLALIIICLWRVRKARKWASTSIINTTLPVIKLLLETGAIYCLATLTILILDLSKNQDQVIILNAVSLSEKNPIPFLSHIIFRTRLDALPNRKLPLPFHQRLA